MTLRAVTKYKPALASINRIFDRVAKERHLDPEELARVVVPDLGLTDLGVHRRIVGDYEVSIEPEWTGKVVTWWRRVVKSKKRVPKTPWRFSESSEPTRTVPAALKANFKEDIRDIKALAKELTVALGDQTQRLEQLYLPGQAWGLADWRRRYADHRLLGFLARRLIWRFEAPGGSVNALYTPDGYVDSAGRPVALDETAEVSLWHPIFSDADEVSAWRRRLIENGRSQPFKQAHREVDLVADAERATGDLSLRFADQILKRPRFQAFAAEHQWQQSSEGVRDGGRKHAVTKTVPRLGPTVRFETRSARAYGLGPSGLAEPPKRRLEPNEESVIPEA
ncbi:MAG: DUF4132 domain-containing protein [Acidobacteriota bacterium]